MLIPRASAPYWVRVLLGGWRLVKMVGEYLEHALQFERMASEATDPALRESLAKQAAAYRKLAKERAERLNLPPIPMPQSKSP